MSKTPKKWRRMRRKFTDKLNLVVDLARVKKFNGQKVDDFLPAGGRL